MLDFEYRRVHRFAPDQWALSAGSYDWCKFDLKPKMVPQNLAMTFCIASYIVRTQIKFNFPFRKYSYFAKTSFAIKSENKVQLGLANIVREIRFSTKCVTLTQLNRRRKRIWDRSDAGCDRINECFTVLRSLTLLFLLVVLH